jgi:hypothetical protein
LSQQALCWSEALDMAKGGLGTGLGCVVPSLEEMERPDFNFVELAAAEETEFEKPLVSLENIIVGHYSINIQKAFSVLKRFDLFRNNGPLNSSYCKVAPLAKMYDSLRFGR